MSPRLFRNFAILLATGSVAMLCGCNVMGYMAQTIAGNPEQPAQYVPDKTKPMVVVAENWKDPSSSFLDAEQLVHFVTENLTERKVAPMIDPMKVSAMATTRPANWRQASIPEIGQSVGAAQVMYINIVSSKADQDPGTGMMSGSTSVLVRMVDAKTGATLWPSDASAGYPLSFQSPMYDTNAPGFNEITVRQGVQQKLGAQIAHLFYNYRPE